mmetsp:Transcript_35856/g.94226  ORF Transcript_35856/g.94226 Transcript_35856/m.94226 type:complete len:98 (+) Transcript_35856:76-369(+)
MVERKLSADTLVAALSLMHCKAVTSVAWPISFLCVSFYTQAALALITNLFGTAHLARMKEPCNRQHRLRGVLDLALKATSITICHNDVVRMSRPCLL